MDETEVELPGDASAPATARRLVEAWFATTLSDDELARARLLVSELVTNAVVHGGERIRLRGELDRRRIRVAVMDDGAGFDPSAAGRDDDAHVRPGGLAVVAALSSRWGVSGAAGTCVWCELDRDESSAAGVSGDRLSVVLDAMAAVDRHAASAIERVCVAAASLLSVSGAGISLMIDGALRGSAGVSEREITAVQELQLTLGEGPCVDAWATDAVIMEPDLAEPLAGRWPTFAPAGVQAGVRAVFAFPLRLGTIRMGALVLYRDWPGQLSGEAFAWGVAVAEVASQVVLAVQAGAPADRVHEVLAGEPAHWAEVHQATGMVAVQLGVSIDEAFVRLRGRAFGDSRPLRDLARDVVVRRLRFEES
jgi:hypothetical protein